MLSRVSGAFTRAVWGEAPAAAASTGGSSAAGSSSAAASGAARTPQEKFLDEFSSAYGPHVPDFVRGSYADAVREAKNRGRLLFLYLHCAAHDDTEEFVRTGLCVESTCNFLRENFVSWMGTTKHADAYRLCQTFNVLSFPYIAVLAPQGSGNSVAVVFRHTGVLTSDALIRELLQRMEMHSQVTQTINATKSAEEEQREQARSLREQQDAEYEESLLMDQGLREAAEREERETEELLRISRETEAAAEAERQRQAALEEERRAAAEAERVALSASLPPEPESTVDGVVTLALRLPNAKKVARRFVDTQTLGTVRQYLASLEEMEPYGDQYQILSNFPRRVHADPDATLASLKLGKQIQLIVESTQEDEEEDDE